MASQVEVSKLNAYINIAPPVDNAAVSKLVMYVWAVPGEGDDTSNRQAHVYSRIIVRS